MILGKINNDINIKGKVGKEKLKQVDFCKYLGVMIDRGSSKPMGCGSVRG